MRSEDAITDNISNQMAITLFWSKVDKSDACWLWSGKPDGDGYGRFRLSGAMVAAHRFAWSITNGRIPNGLFVCHSCDVRLCVRPSHLFVGTQTDNMVDMVRKGRAVRAILTSEMVMEIRSMAGHFEHAEIARRMGVATSTVRGVLYRYTWAWMK